MCGDCACTLCGMCGVCARINKQRLPADGGKHAAGMAACAAWQRSRLGTSSFKGVHSGLHMLQTHCIKWGGQWDGPSLRQGERPFLGVGKLLTHQTLVLVGPQRRSMGVAVGRASSALLGRPMHGA